MKKLYYVEIYHGAGWYSYLPTRAENAKTAREAAKTAYAEIGGVSLRPMKAISADSKKGRKIAARDFEADGVTYADRDDDGDEEGFSLPIEA